MRISIPLLILTTALFCAPAILRAAPPVFQPEPPEPGAADMVGAYLSLLSAGKYEDALLLNDQRGMRQYLLDRRLAELKTKNPEMTQKDLDDMSAQLQVNELNPARLREILLGIMQEAGYEGMGWKIMAFAPSPEETGGYLVRVDARTAAGKEKPILLGIKKLGDQWLVAPEVVENLMARKPVIQVVPTVPPPEEVAATVEEFWKHWQAGELDQAYAMMGSDFRQRVPVLTFLQQAQEMMAKAGVPASWHIAQSRSLAPDVIGLGVNVSGSITGMQSIMVFKKSGETWTLDDVQYRLATPQPGPGPATALPPGPFRQDFRPNFKPAFEPANSIPAAETPAPPPPAAAVPGHPDGPVGPEAK